MRFCNFFIEYKLGLDKIENKVTFKDLSLIRKIAIITIIISVILAEIMLICNLNIFAIIFFIIPIIPIIIFYIINFKKEDLERTLNDKYIPYSNKRMNMLIDILKKHNIDICNSYSISLLIEEAQNAQIQTDYLEIISKPFKTLGAIIVVILPIAIKKFLDDAIQYEIILITISFILLVVLSIAAFPPIIKDIFYRDYKKYDELIYDLRQIRIFYSKEDTTSSD